MNNFFKQTPIKPSNLKPLLPDGVDLNLVTDEIVKSSVKNAAAHAEGARKFGEEIVASRIKEERDKIAQAREDTRKASTPTPTQLWHAKCAQERAEEAAKKAAAEHTKNLLELVEFTSSIGKAALLVDKLPTRDIREIRLLRAALVELEQSLSVKP